MMKLRTRALNGLQNDDEGEGVRLDGGKKNKRHSSDTAEGSYSFASITEDPAKGLEEPSSCSKSKSKDKKRGWGRKPSLDNSISSLGENNQIRDCQESPTNTTSTRSMSTAEEGEHSSEEMERAPAPTKGLTRGGSAVCRGQGRENTGRLAGLVRTVSFRKSRQLMDGSDDEPGNHPGGERRSGLFGGRRRRGDNGGADNINSHIGEIKITKSGDDPKLTKKASMPILGRSRSGDVKKLNKPSSKDSLSSHIGEINITKKAPEAPVEAPVAEDEAKNEAAFEPNFEPNFQSALETESEETDPAVLPLHEELGDIDENEESCNEEDKKHEDDDTHEKEEKQDNEESTENEALDNENKATEEGKDEDEEDNQVDLSATLQNAVVSKESLRRSSAHEIGRTVRSRHEAGLGSRSAHFELRSNKATEDISSSSYCENSFADNTETIEETDEGQLEEFDDRLFVFEEEKNVICVNRDDLMDDISNDNIILQFFLDEENPVVWVLDEGDEGPQKYLELNIVYAAQGVAQNKSKFRISGVLRVTPALA